MILNQNQNAMSEQSEPQGFRAGRGGSRPGAGRKSGWNHPETQMIRVPKVFAQQLLEIARTLDRGGLVGYTSDSDKHAELQEIAQSILNDVIITRQGKDKGAIRRGLDAFLSQVLSNNRTKF